MGVELSTIGGKRKGRKRRIGRGRTEEGRWEEGEERGGGRGGTHLTANLLDSTSLASHFGHMPLSLVRIRRLGAFPTH